MVATVGGGENPTNQWMFQQYLNVKAQLRAMMKDKEIKERQGPDELEEQFQMISDTVRVLKTPVAWDGKHYAAETIPGSLKVRWFDKEITLCAPESAQPSSKRCEEIAKGYPSLYIRQSKGLEENLSDRSTPMMTKIETLGCGQSASNNGGKVLFVGAEEALCLTDMDKENIHADFITSKMNQPASFEYNANQLTMPDDTGKALPKFFEAALKQYKRVVKDKTAPANADLGVFKQEWMEALDGMDKTREYKQIAQGLNERGLEEGGSGAVVDKEGMDKALKNYVMFMIMKAAANDGLVTYKEPLEYLPIYKGGKDYRPGFVSFKARGKSNQKFENALLLASNDKLELGIKAMPVDDDVAEDDELKRDIDDARQNGGLGRGPG